MYICSSMTKAEEAMGETLKRVAKECCSDDIHTQMKKIKKEFLGKEYWGHQNLLCIFCSCSLYVKVEKSHLSTQILRMNV